MSSDITRRGALALGAGGAAMLAGCAQGKIIQYSGPEVTRIVVQKSSRRMHLVHGNRALKSFDIQLGFQPEGHKRFYGDGRTPEGRYFIDRRNPNSEFFLSVGMNYPNARDRAFAASHGRSPGGDIFVHGWGRHPKARRGKDWTAGCIAVTDEEIRTVYAMVQNGVAIDIFA
ncbi:L,D-transpeptidase family protein [Jannaschia aquimarina]|uniref:L,D-transpeptidase catalytic domain n=1 Tax=Jannaschia aquimarina TaxID=935700 RepID=A0A0D1EDW4_9RHOB|nr:L,D-transpeptidase family protein [Jannaschia aquimarina]KIT15126.1 L,D-transpeptidase catalytic domain [Jannaschia aquimarina]SNS64773.1 L,D-transpeptidase catalytic domain [Jannaschia aquimarina]